MDSESDPDDRDAPGLEETLAERTVDSQEGEVVEAMEDEDVVEEAEAANARAGGGKGRKWSSPVWNYGTKVNNGAICNICKVFKSSKYGTTSNMTSHILSKHKDTPEGKKLKVEVENKRKDGADKKKAADKLAIEKKKADGSMLKFVKISGVLDKDKKICIDNALVEYMVCHNVSFATTENHFFRQLMFEAEPNWIAPSDSTVIRRFDVKLEKVRKELKKEIIADIMEAETNCISITMDGGTSKDRMKTKKNGVAIHRTTKDFKLKSDTLAVTKITGSQNADEVRIQLKQVLELYGYNEDWTVNMTTDGASVMVSARASGRHPQVYKLFCVCLVLYCTAINFCVLSIVLYSNATGSIENSLHNLLLGPHDPLGGRRQH